MKRTILLSLFLAGCATTTPLPDGKFLIECDGSSNPWSTCFKQAAKTCPSGYDLISQNTENGPYTGAAIEGAAAFSAHQQKNIVVLCRKS